MQTISAAERWKPFLWIKFPQPLFIVMYNYDVKWRVSSFVEHTQLQMFGNLMQILSAGRKEKKHPFGNHSNICCVTSGGAEENSHVKWTVRKCLGKEEKKENKIDFIAMILFFMGNFEAFFMRIRTTSGHASLFTRLQLINYERLYLVKGKTNKPKNLTFYLFFLILFLLLNSIIIIIVTRSLKIYDVVLKVLFFLIVFHLGSVSFTRNSNVSHMPARFKWQFTELFAILSCSKSSLQLGDNPDSF